jgi:hypothetical protein
LDNDHLQKEDSGSGHSRLKMEWIKKQERILEKQDQNSSQRLEAGMQGIGNLLMTPNSKFLTALGNRGFETFLDGFPHARN